MDLKIWLNEYEDGEQKIKFEFYRKPSSLLKQSDSSNMQCLIKFMKESASTTRPQLQDI